MPKQTLAASATHWREAFGRSGDGFGEQHE